MNPFNTPALETKRLYLRKFSATDIDALFLIYSDREVNTYLPWYPLTSFNKAKSFYEQKYALGYVQPRGYRYAVCLKDDNVPIGYVHVSMEESHDLGYGLRKEFWKQGIITEVAGAVIKQVKQDGIAYITATHDVNNPRSGAVMKRLGMHYQYSYEERWQPKNIQVIFRMYQLNLDGENSRVYRKYWDAWPVHYIESGV